MATTTDKTTTSHCTILIHGQYQTGKQSIISEYTGLSKEKLIVEEENFYYSQVKGTKDNVTIQCLPEEYGRMPVYRERVKAINESQAFIFTVNQHSPGAIARFDTMYNMIKDVKKEMGPTVIIFTHKTDTIVGIPSSLSKFAKKNNVKIETMNTAKFDKVKLEKIIANLSFDALHPVTKSEEKEVVVKKSSSSSPTLNRFIRFFSSFVNVGTAAA